jgi:hypothetical protein
MAGSARLDSMPRIGLSCAARRMGRWRCRPRQLIPFRALPSTQTISQTGPRICARVRIGWQWFSVTPVGDSYPTHRSHNSHQESASNASREATSICRDYRISAQVA